MELAPWMRFHPFVATLEQWAAGVSALCGEPWSEAAICAAIERGPHTSALTPEARDLIDEEMKYQIQAGFSEMVLWRTIQHAYPTNLKVSHASGDTSGRAARSPPVGSVVPKSSRTTRKQTGTTNVGSSPSISPIS
jgi:hypothetical protein